MINAFTFKGGSIIKQTKRLKTDNFTEKEWQLFTKFSPCIAFDDREPLFPIKIGCSIIYKKTHPPNFIEFFERRPFRYKIFKFLECFFLTFIYGRPPIIYKLIRDRFQPVLMTTRNGSRMKRAAKILEYAVLYDADIQHIYDLEHVWVYLDQKNEPISIKATRHGTIVTQYETPDKIRYQKGHPVLFASPGKHAYYTSPNQLSRNILSNVNQSGADRVYPIQWFDEEMWRKILPYYPGNVQIKLYFLENLTYKPSFRYRKYMIPNRKLMTSWDNLKAEVPVFLIKFLKKIQDYFKD
jgi:hypothetical protein